jgi:hypothetical protein
MMTYRNVASMALPAALVSARVARVAVAPAVAALPQVHQAPATLVWLITSGTEGTTGFVGMGIRGSEERTDVRGVPPRGRPV